MPPHIFEDVVCDGGSAGAPLRSVQTASRAANALHLAVLTILAAAIVIPQLGLAGYALLTPAVREQVLAKPLVSLQLVIALVFWVGIFVWPLKNLIMRLSSRCTVEIYDGLVTVTERGPFGSLTRWTLPLSAYKGIARHVRSSLSGIRHELILVHPDPRRSVFLMATPATSCADIDRLARSLDLAEVPVRDLYPPTTIRLPQRRPSPQPA